MRVRAALLSLAAVAVVTGVIFTLKPVAPVLSLGVLYLFAVLRSRRSSVCATPSASRS
jgi:hypothetical protein